MPAASDLLKGVFIGRAPVSSRLGETLLPKKLGIPVLAHDAQSSVAYATEEILVVLALAVTQYLHLTWSAGGAVVVVAIAAYQQNVHAYPGGGGDDEVANDNLGPTFRLVVAGALLVDDGRTAKGHFNKVADELLPGQGTIGRPSRSHAVIVVSKNHNPTLWALNHAKGARPHDLTALSVSVDVAEPSVLQADGEARGLDELLALIASPYREITKPVLDYVSRIRRDSGRLPYQPAEVLTSVPHQLASSDRRKDDPLPDQVRRP